MKLRDYMRNDLIYISGVMAFATAVLLLSLLPAVTAQENNSTIMNNTIQENLTLNNPPAVSSQEGASANSAFYIGNGMDEEVVDTSSLSKDNISFQVDQGNAGSMFNLGHPVKPVRDLEKIVFVCDII